MSAEALTRAGRRRQRKRPRRRATFMSVVGELLITFGVIVLLYVAWQLWVGDIIYAAENNAEGAELSQEWDANAAAVPAPTKDPSTDQWDPVILPEPANAEVFGVMQVPRFGPDYEVRMAGGVTRADTLDPIGIGHYMGSKMPGEVGNASFAAHRTTYGKPFNQIANLKLNDAIVIKTEAGWYTYRFRTLEYVTPDSVDVLNDVPQRTDVEATERYLTLTSCSPMYSLAERIVAYAVFDSFQPISEGPPASLTEGVS